MVSTLELGERFDQLNWDGIDDNTDLDDPLEYFVTKVNEVLEDLIPEKKTAKVKTHRSQPWLCEILKHQRNLGEEIAEELSEFFLQKIVKMQSVLDGYN